MKNPFLHKLPHDFTIFLYAILLLTFLQLLTALIEATYAFGLLQTGFPVEVVSILLLLSPLLLFAVGRWLKRAGAVRWFLLVTGGLALLCRSASLLLDTRGKMIASGAGAGLLLLFFPVLLWHFARQKDRQAGMRLGVGLALAGLTWMLLNTLGAGNETSQAGFYPLITWVLDLLGLLLLAAFGAPDQPDLAQPPAPLAEDSPRPAASGGAIWASLGLVSCLTLLYFGLANPSVIQRWTDSSYQNIAFGLAIMPALGLELWMGLRALRLLPGWVVLAWNLAFTACLALTLWFQQVPLPAQPAAYPFAPPPISPLAGVTLLLMLLLSPVIYLDFALLVNSLVKNSPSLARLAAGFSLAALYLLLVTFAQVFTTVYDYIPVVGPMLRDRFWMVYLVLGLGLTLMLVLSGSVRLAAQRRELPQPETGQRKAEPQRSPVLASLRYIFPAFAALCAVAAVLTTSASQPPSTVLRAAHNLRILTFNIQQGYSADGQKNLLGQVDAIAAANADIVGLQESDIARVSGGNSDIVRLAASRLGYYSYYGPSTVTGTFGVALLSRYPIEDPHTFYMYSAGEQTAAIEAGVTVNGKTYTILVTHLGNGGPIIQQQNVLQQLAGKSNIIAMGDFNFRPASPQYDLTVRSLQDAWLAAAQRVEAPGVNAARRIDQVFLSPGISVNKAQFFSPGPADHPALLVEIGE